MKNTLKYTLAALAATVLGTQAALITGVSASASSEINGSGLFRAAFSTVDGSGLTGVGTALDTHGNAPDPTLMWLTTGSIGFTGAADTDPAMTFDLGGLYDVDTLRVWNYNETGSNGDGTFNWTTHGADEIAVSAGATLGTMTQLQTINVLEAGGTAAEAAQDFASTLTGVQFIRFTIVSNHDGDNFVTDVYNTALDTTQFTGLSEVRFEGTAVPEPATLSMMAAFGGAVLFIRRKLM